MAWRDIKAGTCRVREPLADEPAAGASLFVPFQLAPGRTKTVRVHIAWYMPKSDLFQPPGIMNLEEAKLEPYTDADTYRPWYAGRFSSVGEVIDFWQRDYPSLRQATGKFTRTFYDSTLPPEVIEAVAANLTILKSPTVMRQTDGRFWGWEGSFETVGSCYGSSTHVWNYAQAVPHLFPALERSLRETELGPDMDADGNQVIRAALPIRPLEPEQHVFPAAADGQLGGILKVYRDWRVSGDTEWLRRLWPKVRVSLDYCIRTWDPEHRGRIEEPHINTYDVEFWGADSLCTSLYAGALKAATLMGAALSEPVEPYARLLAKAVHQMETDLFNGEYFIQRTQWQHLKTPFPQRDGVWALPMFAASADEVQVTSIEGPKYQYGPGCLSDGVLGVWLSWACGIDDLMDAGKVASHLTAVHRYNFKEDFTQRASVQRCLFACGHEAGLLLCSWPKGGEPTLPFFYGDEVWTGVEYQVASHLISTGKAEEGLDIVRACRTRYDGRRRNPFDELETGHWYARAMSSYALLQALSGARFDAVDRTLYLRPAIQGDFRSFLSTATGYGTVGVKNGRPFVEVISGEIPYKKIDYRAAAARTGPQPAKI
jgi:uncharacterized protein (DUF608 family)